MGIFDFFKKLKKQEEVVVEVDRVKLEDLESYLGDRKEKLLGEEKDFVKKVKSMNGELIETLDGKVEELRGLDLEEKKAEDRVKVIVGENFKNYLYSVELLVKELRKLDGIDISSELINKINIVFSGFEKKTHSSYHKATYLIGEVGQVKEEIGKYFKELEGLIKENEGILKSLDNLDSCKKILESLSKIKEDKNDIDNEIDKYKEDIKSNQGKVDGYKEKIKDISESDKHKEFLENSKSFVDSNKELDSKINVLKSMVDLKALSSIYHKSEKDMRVIKEYKSNFLESFKEDSDDKFKKILETANQIENKEEIMNHISDIIVFKQKIVSLSDSIDGVTEKEINKLNGQIKHIENDIENIEGNIEKDGKRLDKSRESENSTIDSLKDKLKEINVNLI